MDLTPFVDNVRRQLAVAAEAGGDEARVVAERLSAPLASAIRLTLLDALSAAADEITRDLAPGSVELRLRTGEASFAVTPPVVEPPTAPDTAYAAPAEEPVPADDDSSMVRINLRLPENLKQRVEEAAAAEGRSVNAWLVRAASSALRPTVPPSPAPSASGGHRSTQHYTGWVS